MNSKLSIEDIQAEKWFRNILDNKLYEKMKYIYKVSLMNNENIENLEKISNEKINYEMKQFEEKLKQYEEKLKENEDQYKQYKLKFDDILKENLDFLKNENDKKIKLLNDENVQNLKLLNEKINYLKEKNENIKVETETYYKEIKKESENSFKQILQSKDEVLKEKNKEIDNLKNLSQMFNLKSNKVKGDFAEHNDYNNLINAYSNNTSFRILDTNREQGGGDIWMEVDGVKIMIETKNYDEGSMHKNFKGSKARFLKNFEKAKRENKVDLAVMSFYNAKGIPVWDGTKHKHGMINNIEYELENFENINQDCLAVYIPQSGANEGFNLINGIRLAIRLYHNLNCATSADIKTKIRKCQKILLDSRTNINEIILIENRFHNDMKQKLESAQNYVIELLDYIFEDNTQLTKSDHEKCIRRIILYLKVKHMAITKENIKKFRHNNQKNDPKSEYIHFDFIKIPGWKGLKISEIDNLLVDNWRIKYSTIEEKEEKEDFFH